MNKPNEIKTAYRDRLLHLRKNIANETTAQWLEQIETRLLSVVENQPTFKVIAGYTPIKGEIDALFIMRRLHQMGRKLALPKVNGDHLEFLYWQPGETLMSGKFGIKEPLPKALPATPNMIIVPIVGFDRECHRIGYGGGYYDRIGLRYPNAKRIGLAYEVQMVPEVPREAWDMQLDMIITENEIITS
ncbi:MAG: 5-formyltetrahydrofolate cyclo-ligase [Proteobacteria bacterium]|nr:5-formyltetrahydrofolate cyclo-ligase [Pseudomonadota bacterium]